MGSRLTDFFRRVFGGDYKSPTAENADAVEYKGYLIRPLPRGRGSEWTTEGAITKHSADRVMEHRFIRVDTHGDKTDAVAFCVAKAKQIIDERGDRMFDEA